MHDILDIALRSLSVYLFMIFAIRIFGKTQLSQLNSGDVVLLLLISNAVQNAMVGPNTSLTGGLVAALVLFTANFIVKKFIFRIPSLKRIIQDGPYELVKDGVVFYETLKKVNIDTDELLETVHEHGVEKLAEVKLAILEVDGNISVVSADSKGNTHYTRHRKFPKKRDVI